MAVATTADFNLNADEILDAAYARVGGEDVTGYNARFGRRSLQLLLNSWQNRGINLWTVEQRTETLVDGQIAYTLADDVIDVLDAVTRRGTGQNQIDLDLTRIGRSEYSVLPNKNTTGRPYQYYVDRGRDAPTVYFYPVPDSTTTTFVYYCIRRVKDVPALSNSADVPSRFLPALVSGVAYYVSRERAQIVGEPTIARLKGEYEADFAEAAAEDRDRANFRITPDFSCYQSW